jgi:putative FmdB family regulatory protein
MPVYSYRCENCGHQFDRHQGFEEKSIQVCPNCRKHTLHKLYRPGGVVFKGSGFYVNDKKTKASSSNGSGPAKKPKEAAKGDAKPEGKTETKPESKPETKKPKAKTDD